MTGRALSVWCADGNHLDCAASEDVCQCACHGATRRRATSTKRTGFGKPGGTTTERAARKPRALKPLYAPDHPAAPPAVKSRTVVRPDIRKEDAPCCTSRRDSIGRLPIGFCSPGCVRRPR